MPEIRSPMPNASSGGLSEKFDKFQEPREAGPLVFHLMCRDGKLKDSLQKKRAVRALAARVPQVWKGARTHPGRRRRSQRCPSRVAERLLCLGTSTSPRFTASCCRDGSLAVIQPLRSSKLPRNHPHVAVFTLILRVTYMRPSELLELKKKDLVPSPVPLLPCRSVVIAAEVIAKTGSPRWVGLVDQRWLQWVNKLLPRLKCGIWKADPVFRSQRRTGSKQQPTMDLSGMIKCQARVQKHCKKFEREVNGEHSLPLDTTIAVVWQPSTTLSRARSEYRAEALLIRRLQVRWLTHA